jgi:hypothetical protein
MKTMAKEIKNYNWLMAGIIATLWFVRRSNNKKNEKKNNYYRLTCHLFLSEQLKQLTKC